MTYALHKDWLPALSFVLLIACSGATAKKETVFASGSANEKQTEWRQGDIVFQVSRSGQGAAIQAATRSKYSHCGMLFQESGKFYVLEAVQPVKITSIEKWIKQGDDGHYVIKRLKEAEKVLTPAVIEEMKKEGKKMLGKNYDLTFRWSDDRIYCSELVWKIYQRTTGIELASLDSFRDFDLTGELTRMILKDRFGDKVPYDEKAISPGKLFESDRLRRVQVVN
ncbi:MAG: YiiX family permuted papain-like enzyme [Bacteroidota bacterium]